MSQRPDLQDPDRDPALDRAYRAADRDEPPARLDDAIRAAARREVGARPQSTGGGGFKTWRVPVSIAAMLVVGVSVVTLVREEHPQVLEVPPPAPAVPAPAAEAPKPQVPLRDGFLEQQAVPAAPGRQHKDAVTQSPAQAAPDAKLASPPPVASEEAAAPLKRERRNEQEATTAARNVSSPLPEAQRPAPQAFGTPEPRPAEASPASAEPLRSAPAVGAAAADSAARAAPRPAPRADSAAPPAPAAAPLAEGRMAKAQAQAQAQAPAQAEVDTTGLNTPEQWLARIRDWRKQGRVPEAAKLLAAFRQRYPGYPLPPDLQEGIQP